MRVKIKEKANVPKLEYGKTYEIVVTTVSWTYRFKFTRKNHVLLTEVNNCTVQGPPSRITKKTLKNLINATEFTEKVVEVQNLHPVYICKKCGSYCDTKDCYLCNKSSSAKLKEIEINNVKDIESINQVLLTLNKSSFRVMLSHLGDCPAEIDIIPMTLQEINTLLQNQPFLNNKTTAVSKKGQFYDCLGLALLSPFIYKEQDVYGMFILLEEDVVSI